VRAIGRNIFIGLVTAAPLAVTYFILRFLYTFLSEAGRPWIRGVARGLQPQYPEVAELLLNETLQSIAAVLIVLIFLYLLGWATGRVVGRKIIDMLELWIVRIPLVDKIYQATKKFLVVTGRTPEGERRVVLIDFPSPDMKAIGIITKVMRDRDSDAELAVVYVPTAPNPTNGYIEIVPMERVVMTDWTFDQAMSFVVTGGTNAPDDINYTNETRL